MSSSRDQSSFTGVPGMCFAISPPAAPSRAPPRRPKPPPRCACTPRTARKAGRTLRLSRQKPPRRSACRTTPHTSRRPTRRRVQHLHRGVILVGIAVDRLDLLARRRRVLPRIAEFIADNRRLRRSQDLLRATSRSMRSRPWRSRLRPRRWHRLERGLGVPPGVGDHGDRVVADLHHLLHALHAGDLASS